MLARLSRLPFFLMLFGLAGLAMMAPALYAGSLHDLHEARAFFYSSILILFIFGLIALAMTDTNREPRTVDFLVSLFLPYVLLPLVMERLL